MQTTTHKYLNQTTELYLVALLPSFCSDAASLNPQDETSH